MVRGGERIQMEDNELPNMHGCIKAGGEAGKDGGIKGIVELQLLTKLGYEFRSIRLAFLSLGGRRHEEFSCSEHGVELQMNGPPFEPIKHRHVLSPQVCSFFISFLLN